MLFSEIDRRDLTKDVFHPWTTEAVLATEVKFPGVNGIGFLAEIQVQDSLSRINKDDTDFIIETRSVAGFLGLNFRF